MAKKQTLAKYHMGPLKMYVKRIGCAHLLPKLNKSKKFWENMNDRYLSIYYELEDYSVGIDIQNDMADVLSKELWSPAIKLPCLEYYISLWDFWVHAMSFEMAVRMHFGEDSKIFKEVISVTGEIQEYADIVHEHFSNSFAERLNVFSNPESFTYSFTWDISTSAIDPRITVNLERKKTERREIVLNGKKRNLYRPGLCLGDNFVISPEITHNKIEYPVYIQAHAIRRLEERIDTIPVKHLRQFITGSFIGKELRFYNKTYLIAYEFYGFKLGYFVCDLIDDICVVKTFLFISQDGTPEGDVLSEKLSIERTSKKHFNLNKLSHFTASDIREDEMILPILQECTMDHLCKVFREPEEGLAESALYIRDCLQLAPVAS